jgi:RNA polymerase sigma factor for flagellar operon FliA
VLVKEKQSGFSALDRYKLEVLILDDPAIGRWFADVCTGNRPTVEVPEEILAILEGAGFIRKTDFGWVLRADGRKFARNLGLIPGPSRVETRMPSAVIGDIHSRPSVSKGAEGEKSIESIWREYQKTRSVELRNQLIETYLPLVKYNAERVWAKLPNEVELDDLISSGILGLVDAIEAFDLDRGVKFSTYCSQRICGAILDDLRERNWVPRTVRNRIRRVEETSKALEAELGRPPTRQELAQKMKLPPEEFEQVINDTNISSFISLSRPTNESDSHEDLREIDVLEDKRVGDPIFNMHKKDIKGLIMRGLSRAERLIVLLYYYEEMKMSEIGRMLNLSESRVSQMHSAIVKRLGQHLLSRRKDFDAELPKTDNDADTLE